MHDFSSQAWCNSIGLIKDFKNLIVIKQYDNYNKALKGTNVRPYKNTPKFIQTTSMTTKN